MGFAFAGSCHSSSAAALEAFQASFPKLDGVSLASLNGSSVSGATISYDISTRAMATGTIVDRSGTFNLSPCNAVTASMSDSMTGLAFAMLMAFFSAFFLRKAFRKFATFAGGMANDF